MWSSLKSSGTNWNESETIENLQDELELSLKTGETCKAIKIANKIIKNPLYTETACLNFIIERIQNDPLLASHCKFYIKEIKIRAYSQLLRAYSSLTFAKISDEFLIPIDVVENELSKFIKKKKIHCQIDGVSQCVINSCTGVGSSLSSSVCHRDKLYKDIIKNGDILMNRLQILSTIIDI
ncbi:26S proteasome non-ATPase regulatory subunit 6-like [Aphidius gifuensis]|uniref:26S proteasome non-ATPase regulatory subunit 6-like n=1 Tax=Aphidius gifuensis TaxID=684658 RepID=UPI001CDD5800|nr:26S proteasome non-ATPase regulatory subunit 6-like [Aphidius gifuensis]